MRRRSLPAAPPATPPEEIEYAPTQKTPPWIEAIGVVVFDLLVGQSVEYLCPPLPFSADQETEIAFLCFPDANLVEDGDNCHDFVFAFNKSEFDLDRTTVKRERCRDKAPSPSNARSSYDSDSVEYFCSTLFRQKKDPTVTRGAQQKALFVMSQYPMTGFFHCLLEHLCNRVFSEECIDVEVVLEQAVREIGTWPSPLPNLRYSDLPLLGSTFSTITPSWVAADLRSRWSDSDSKTKFSIHSLSPEEKLIEVAMNIKTETEGLHFACQQFALSAAPEALDMLKSFGWDSEHGFEDIPSKEKRLALASKLLGAGSKAQSTGVSPHQQSAVDSLAKLLGACDASYSEVFSALNNELAQLQNECFEHLKFKPSESTKRIDASERVFLFHEVEVHSALYPHITKLSKLWELMIVGAPVAMVGPNASHVSAAIMALPSLIAPLHYIGMVRPYLTINNREIDTCIQRVPTSGSVAGATNPFFVKHFDKWPHFICFANMEGDVQTHKMFPENSEKRAKQQFKLKNRMFCSRHYLVKTDKGMGDGWVKMPPVGSFVSPKCGKASDSVFKYFQGITEEFLTPIKSVISAALCDGTWFFATDEELETRFNIASLLEAVQEHPQIPLHRFKTSKEALMVYEGFLKTPTFQHFLANEIQVAYRCFLLGADSLEAVITPARTPERMLRVLNSLQWTFKHEVRKKIVDVALVQKLSALCALIPAVREVIARNSQ